MNIYLVGYMGSGKSTLGRKLAGLLGFNHLDLDVLFEESYRISIMDFYQKYDEQAFRIIERKLLIQTFGLSGFVVSTGGGTACYSNNMELINENGLSLYIRMQEKSLFERLKHSRRPRPRTARLDDYKLEQQICTDMQSREQFYKQALFNIKGEDFRLDDLVSSLRAALDHS